MSGTASAEKLDTDEARERVGRSMAAIEADYSQAWPRCPRGGLKG